MVQSKLRYSTIITVPTFFHSSIHSGMVCTFRETAHVLMYQPGHTGGGKLLRCLSIVIVALGFSRRLPSSIMTSKSLTCDNKQRPPLLKQDTPLPQHYRVSAGVHRASKAADTTATTTAPRSGAKQNHKPPRASRALKAPERSIQQQTCCMAWCAVCII